MVFDSAPLDGVRCPNDKPLKVTGAQQSGKVITEHISELRANELVASGSFAFRPNMSDDDKQWGALLTMLAHGVETPGFLTLVDGESGQWLVPNDRIPCLNVRDRRASVSNANRVGFEPILAEEPRH